MKTPNFLKKIMKMGKHRKNPDVIRQPSRTWKYLLIGFFTLALVVAGVDGYLFYEINAGGLFTQSSTPTPVSAIDRSLLQNISDLYSTRATSLDTLKTSQPAVVDPLQ